MYWTYFTNEVKWISAGSSILGVDGDGMVVRYDHQNDSWIPYPHLDVGKTADKAFCGNDGTILALESGTGHCYRYDHIANRWFLFETSPSNFGNIAMADNGLIFMISSVVDGVGDLGRYYAENEIEYRASGVVDASAASDGTVLVVKKDGWVVRLQDGKLTSGLDANAKGVCVQSASHLMIITKENQILFYVGEGHVVGSETMERYWDETAGAWRYRKLEYDILRMTIANTGTCYIQAQPDPTNKDLIYTYRMIPLPPQDDDMQLEQRHMKLETVEQVEIPSL